MVEYAKMQGCGNDFILVRREDLRWPLSAVARLLCDRRFGIGADGLMAAGSSANAAVRMVYYNSDGSRAALCGNGIRCFARYAREQGWATEEHFTVESDAGIHRVRLAPGGNVTVEMGKPQLDAAAIPVALPGPQVLNREYHEKKISCVRVGVPHTVWFTKPGAEPDLCKEATFFAHNPDFPEGTNLNAVTIISPDQIKVRTWERGAGQTLACGSGCCAAVAAGLELGLLRRQVQVWTDGGMLQVSRDAEGVFWLTGAARWICRGQLCGELFAQLEK